jgi:hypothetical protein
MRAASATRRVNRLNPSHCLADVHVAAIDDRAAGAPRRLQQLGLEREVDDLRDPHRGAQHLRRQRDARHLRHAGRRRMDHAGGARERRAKVLGRARALAGQVLVQPALERPRVPGTGRRS